MIEPLTRTRPTFDTVTLRNRQQWWLFHASAQVRGCGAYPVDMSDTKSPVYLDADLLARLDRFADEAGVDRDTYVEEALRRHLAGSDLVALQREVSARSRMSFEDALGLVHAERDAARSERASGQADGSSVR